MKNPPAFDSVWQETLLLNILNCFFTFFQTDINASSNSEALTVRPGAVGDEDALPDG